MGLTVTTRTRGVERGVLQNTDADEQGSQDLDSLEDLEREGSRTWKLTFLMQE